MKKAKTSIYTDKELMRAVRIKLLQTESHGSFTEWLDHAMKKYLEEK